MAFLEVKELKKAFSKVDVLKGVSFSLEKGNILAIVGPSGGGKTTLMRCLNFLETPNSGIIKLDNKVIFGNSKKFKKSDVVWVRDMFGLVFQTFNLFPQYSVLQNVKLALEIVEKRRKKQGKPSIISNNTIDDEAKNVLKKLGLEDKLDSYPCELSGGQKQRVAIARALVLKPMVLCFDEPTSALDPKLTREVVKLIKEVKNKFGITILIVTHEMKFASEVADDAIFIYDGRVLEYGKANQIFKEPKSRELKEFLNMNDN